MTYTHILRGLLLTVLVVPMTTLAYTSPEEVLNSDENAGFYNPPPSPRHTQEIQAQQQASVAAWRAAEQQALFEKSSASSAPASDDIDPLHGAAPSESTYGQTSGLSATDQRILERVKAQQAQAEMDAAVEARVRVLTSQQGLHSGAPLTDSGPGTVISAFVLAGAGLWTIWKAKRLEREQN